MGLYISSTTPKAVPTLIDPLTHHIIKNPIRVLTIRYEMVLAICRLRSTTI